MNYYHITSQENADNILREGFIIGSPSSYGDDDIPTFGKGIYLCDNLEDVKSYAGDLTNSTILKVEIDDMPQEVLIREEDIYFTHQFVDAFQSKYSSFVKVIIDCESTNGSRTSFTEYVLTDASKIKSIERDVVYEV